MICSSQKEEYEEYTVTFDADRGEPETQTRTVESGGTVGADNMPDEPAKSGYTFGGWYTVIGDDGDEFTDSTPVSADVTVYAIMPNIFFEESGCQNK
jgi:uncharacterized repeat protein (TIGR02543 family)